jgi:ornithine--oxo-acid transaminase
MRTDAPQEARTGGSSREERALERLAHLTPNYRPQPRLFVRGEGSRLYDADGRVYLDLVCGIATCALGHCHPALVEALTEQAGRLWHTSNLYLTEPAPRLAELLTAHSFADRVFFANSGTEANEAAIKLARRFHHDQGTPRSEIVVFENSFHGRTLGSPSATAQPKYHVGFGPLVPGFVVVKYGDAAALERAVSGRTAAVMLEPIQGEGGVVIPPDDYLPGVRALCTREQVLFVADEIQAGLGRTGYTFACDHAGVKPDMYILGKALGGGIVPVSAVVADRDVLGVIGPGQHGSTFGGNPLACAVGTAVIDLLETGEFQARAEALGQVLRDRLLAMVGKGIVGFRSRGLWAGVDIDPAIASGREICERLLARGVLAKDTHGSTIRLAPPLVIAEEDLHWALDQLEAAVSA